MPRRYLGRIEEDGVRIQPRRNGDGRVEQVLAPPADNGVKR
jgi:hypothetical protein